MQLQLKMLDHFGNFDKKVPNAFIPSNEFCQYASIIAHSHANLKPEHNMDIGSFLVYSHDIVTTVSMRTTLLYIIAEVTGRSAYIR